MNSFVQWMQTLVFHLYIPKLSMEHSNRYLIYIKIHTEHFFLISIISEYFCLRYKLSCNVLITCFFYLINDDSVFLWTNKFQQISNTLFGSIIERHHVWKLTAHPNSDKKRWVVSRSLRTQVQNRPLFTTQKI